jgi:hypothetical protein
MSEGDVPEIPQHLKESVQSADAYQGAIRRHFQIEVKAHDLGIPTESLQNPTVHRYVSVLRDLWAYSERLQFRRGTDAQATRHEALSSEGLLYRSAAILLEPGPEDIASMRHHLEDFVRGHGVGGGVNMDRKRRFPAYHPKPTGLWAAGEPDALPRPPWRRHHGQPESWWYRVAGPDEEQYPEHVAAVASEAQRQGISAEVAGSDSMVRARLSDLVHGRELPAEVTNLESLSEAPGLTPSPHERLRMVAPMVRLGVAAQEERFRSGSVTPDQITQALAPVLDHYALKITR